MEKKFYIILLLVCADHIIYRTFFITEFAVFHSFKLFYDRLFMNRQSSINLFFKKSIDQMKRLSKIFCVAIMVNSGVLVFCDTQKAIHY